MGKSVYSLVLNDAVVRAVDREAYTRGMSRSGMIERILAEYVSYMTPEKRMQDAFEEIANLLTESGTFQMLMKPSGSMLSLRSCLSYKYNPTLRYSVELLTKDQDARIRLKILLRSQSQNLIFYLERFFMLWQSLEGSFYQKEEQKAPVWQMEPARYIRELILPKEDITGGEFGERIASYIAAVDEGMKAYFALLDEPEKAIGAVKKTYEKYVQPLPYRI